MNDNLTYQQSELICKMAGMIKTQDAIIFSPVFSPVTKNIPFDNKQRDIEDFVNVLLETEFSKKTALKIINSRNGYPNISVMADSEMNVCYVLTYVIEYSFYVFPNSNVSMEDLKTILLSQMEKIKIKQLKSVNKKPRFLGMYSKNIERLINLFNLYKEKDD
jgi:hypothetical protein